MTTGSSLINLNLLCLHFFPPFFFGGLFHELIAIIPSAAPSHVERTGPDSLRAFSSMHNIELQHRVDPSRLVDSLNYSLLSSNVPQVLDTLRSNSQVTLHPAPENAYQLMPTLPIHRAEANVRIIFALYT